MGATFSYLFLFPLTMEVWRERKRGEDRGEERRGEEWRRGVNTAPSYLDVSKIKRAEKRVDVPPLILL